MLGLGNYPKVVKAYSQKQRQYVAIKMYQLNYINQIDLKQMEKHIKIIIGLTGQKYILPIIETFQDYEFGLIAIVTELCDYNLKDLFRVQKMSIQNVQAMVYQLLSCVHTLQQYGIIHTNIKPENVLYSKEKNVFLIDYTLSKQCCLTISSKDANYLTNDNKYQSPQVIAQRKPYNAQVDIFSIGLLGSEALFQQSLSSQQLLSLQNKNIFKAFPNLQSPNEKEFVQTILCRMLEPVYPQPVQLNQLLQNLKYFNIDESCLVKQEINKYIGFYENQNYDEIENVVKDLENNQRISSLDIYPINEINNKVAQLLRNFLQKFHYLNSFTICHIKKSISIDEVHNLGKILDIGHNISRLNIRLYALDKKIDFESIGISVQHCQNIVSLTLELEQQRVNCEGVKHLGKALEMCQKITFLQLNLGGNDIQSEGIKSLGKSLVKCLNIIHLGIHLQNNNITYEGIKSLGKSLELCHNLVKLSLNLSGNKITNEGVKNLGRSLESCHNLSSLALSLVYNKLNNEGIRSLGKSLEACQNMNSLDLNLGNFTKNNNEGVNSLAKSLQACTNLKCVCLQFRNNQQSYDLLLQKIKKMARLVTLSQDLSLIFFQ